MRDRPKLPAETLMVERGERFLFLVPSKPDWAITNANGAYVLSLCDGSRTLCEIRAIVASKHPSPQDAINFIDKLFADGFFETSQERPKTRSGVSQLYSVHLNIWPDCNLKCNYCYAEERSPEGSTLSLNEYKKVIDDLVKISPTIQVALTGGEPLLNKDAIDISTYCRSKGFYTHLLTNATPITSKNAHRIAKGFDEIRISIDGSTAGIHDFHRGAGAHAKTVRAIDELSKHGANIRIAMTVTKENIGDLSSVAKMYGDKLMFQPLFNAGTAKLNRELAITGEQYYRALSEAEGVATMSGIGRSLQKLRNRGSMKCAIGDSEISISHSGDVYPCHMVHLDEFKAGNVRDRSIVAIYNDSAVLMATRTLDINARRECRECPIRLLCGGACRARAMYLSGDLNSFDDFCDYEFAAFIDGLFQSVQ